MVLLSSLVLIWTVDLKQSLAEFAHFVRSLKGDEKSEAQTFTPLFPVINSSCAEPGFFATRNSDVAPAAKSLIVFLKQLEDYGEFVSDVTIVRRRTARAKCRKVAKQLQPGRAVNAATVCRESESFTDDDASLFGGRIARHATTDFLTAFASVIGAQYIERSV